MVRISLPPLGIFLSQTEGPAILMCPLFLLQKSSLGVSLPLCPNSQALFGSDCHAPWQYCWGRLIKGLLAWILASHPVIWDLLTSLLWPSFGKKLVVHLFATLTQCYTPKAWGTAPQSGGGQRSFAPGAVGGRVSPGPQASPPWDSLTWPTLDVLARPMKSRLQLLPSSLCFLESESESRSVLSDSLRPHGLSMEFSRPEYWSG